MLAYGEQKAIQDAKESGANGFIMVDLPPEEATAFRDKCTAAGYESPSVLRPTVPHSIPAFPMSL